MAILISYVMTYHNLGILLFMDIWLVSSYTHEHTCILHMCIYLCVYVYVQITNIAVINILYIDNF